MTIIDNALERIRQGKSTEYDVDLIACQLKFYDVRIAQLESELIQHDIHIRSTLADREAWLNDSSKDLAERLAWGLVCSWLVRSPLSRRRG